jgi:hypothetical protein
MGGIESHPIYEFLPASFKNELVKLVEDNHQLKVNPLALLEMIMNNKGQAKKETFGKPNARLDTYSDEQMLEYLRL